jgi:23S rRNA (adenine2503-C2)-methyltransferase
MPGLGTELLQALPLKSGGTLRRARRRSEPWVGFEWLEEPGASTISLQSGCAIGCLFCDAGTLPYSGNLTLEELRLQEGGTKGELRLTRMGEPTFNPAVLDLLEQTQAERVLLSTVAPDTPVSERFLDILLALRDRRFGNGRLTLQISFPSTEREGRRALVPVRTWSAKKIADFGARWVRGAKERIVLNVPLTGAFAFEPEEAAASFDPKKFSWTFTPVHPSGRALRNRLENCWDRPPESVLERIKELARFGFQSRAVPSAAASVEERTGCGQLRSA